MPPRRGRQQQKQSVAPLILLGGVVAAGYVGWMRGPAMAAIWLSLIVAAFMEPSPALSGKPDPYGNRNPIDKREKRSMGIYQFWSALKRTMLFSIKAWEPGWPVYGAWLAGVFAGLLATQLPVDDRLWMLVNALCLFASISSIAAARRQSAAQGDSPGVRIDSLVHVLRQPQHAILYVLAGVVVAVAAVYSCVTYIPDDANITLFYPLIALSTFMLGLFGAAAPKWSSDALAHWRMVVRGRAEWETRWGMTKLQPPPFLMDRQEVASALVDSFESEGSLPSSKFWTSTDKIAPTIGAGSQIAILSVANENDSGPMPGSRHPLRFQIVNWINGETPDISDPNIDPDVALLYLHCVFAWVFDGMGHGRPLPVSIQPIHVETVEKAAWACECALPDGPSFQDIRKAAGALASALNMTVLVDDTTGIIYFGNLEAEKDDFQPYRSEETYPALFKRLDSDDNWNYIWGQALKQDANPPLAQHATAAEEQLADGTVVKQLAWMVRLGINPTEFFLIEPKLATAMESIPFLTVTGWLEKSKQGQSVDRHPQAFTLYWSDKRVPPSPELLAPSGKNRAQKWVIAGQINHAFVSGRLARPEVIKATPLSAASRPTKDDEASPKRHGRLRKKPQVDKHLWSVQLRLYGGVTLADVRGAQERIRQSLGVTWLRIEPAEDGCTLYVGARPDSITLANPARYEQHLTGLDWSQSWIDSGVSGVGGQVPTLSNLGFMENNPDVQWLDFDLPPGIDLDGIKKALPKLRNATSNFFIEVRRGDGASVVRLLVCEYDPLPTMVPYDFEINDSSELLPFATGVEGDPIFFDIKEAPHALLAGLTGSGKSYLAMMLLYGALTHGWECYIIDPIKGGADFAFAKDRCRAFAATPFQAAGVMHTIYDEVVRRKNLNAQHGVGSYTDLPDEIRPPHMLVLIDEFTSLLGKATLPPKSDDLTMNTEREAIEAENHARTEIGVYAGKLAREARSAGVTLMLGTQKLTSKMLDSVPGASDLRSNLARCLLGKASWGDLAAALRSPNDAPKLDGEIGKGRGVWEPVSSPAKIIQVWYASQEDLRGAIIERIPEIPEKARVDVSQFVSPFEDMPDTSVSAPAANQDIDLGEITFTMDDLFGDDEDEGDEEFDGPMPTMLVGNTDRDPAEAEEDFDDDQFVIEPSVTDTPVVAAPPPDELAVPQCVVMLHSVDQAHMDQLRAILGSETALVGFGPGLFDATIAGSGDDQWVSDFVTWLDRNDSVQRVGIVGTQDHLADFGELRTFLDVLGLSDVTCQALPITDMVDGTDLVAIGAWANDEVPEEPEPVIPQKPEPVLTTAAPSSDHGDWSPDPTTGQGSEYSDF